MFAIVICAVQRHNYAFASHHHEQVALELLKAKADPNKADAKGFVALMHAARGSAFSSDYHLSSDHHEQVARELLKAGACRVRAPCSDML